MVRPLAAIGAAFLASVGIYPAEAETAATLPPDAEEGPRLTTQGFGAWTYHCAEAMIEGKPGRPTCELDQTVVVQQDGKAPNDAVAHQGVAQTITRDL